MKPASSNFSAPRTYVFDLIGGTGAGTTIQFEIFCGEFFEGSRPNPNAQAEPKPYTVAP